MIKILISIGSLQGGGAERVVSLWSDQLHRAGYEVYILTYARQNGEYMINPNVKVLTAASTIQDYLKLSYVKRFQRMRQLILQVRPDVMINFLPRMQIWMHFSTLGIKTYRIETVRNNPWKTCPDNKFGRFLWNRCFKKANAVIIQTAEQGEYFNDRIQKKCVVIPNPIDDRYLTLHKTQYAPRIRDFIAAGRITPQKNYELMIDAFSTARRAVPDIRLSIFGIGEEPYVNSLQQKVNDLGMTDAITFEGRSNRMSEELLKRDAFLMTSDYEGMPNALLEAMVCGLVCVSTDCKTGPRDLIDPEKNGYLVPVGDADTLAETIVRVAGLSGDEISDMGTRAREKVLRVCDAEHSQKKLISLIENGVR